MKKVNIFSVVIAAMVVAMGMSSCQKMERPALGDYEQDKLVTPTTPLRFYVPFDSTTAADKQINIRFKDSISGYPSFFPSASIGVTSGIHGTAYQGTTDAYLSYVNSNDFVKTAESFTVALWEKINGAPQGNAAFMFNIPSTNGNWANTTMFLLLDWSNPANNDLAILKFYVVDKNLNDGWLTWEGNNRVPGIQDNKWHHLAFVYDATTSKMTLYVDGVANPNQPQWGTHGAVNMDATKASGLNIGGRNVKDLGWGQDFGGALDQFRLYNKALSAGEVQALFNGKM
ncbi:MAG: LamG domain-containing protein [Flavisolibacter sp.]